jgi:RNA polymerase sigma-70 factor (ECF subfamily)
MTGSVGDAEDIVQGAFLRLTRALQAGTVVADPKAYLTTAVTGLGINYLRSARVRRETYVGDWLPEPVVVPVDEPGPAEHAELADALSMAFLVLLEAEGEEFARRFFDAAAGGDMDALLGMLAPDVVFRDGGGDGDGDGGKAQALGQPLTGRERVLRLLGGLFRRGRAIGAYHRLAWVNGQPGAVTYDAGGRVVNVFALDIADGTVQAIRSVVNPDKLGHLGPVSDLARLPQKEQPPREPVKDDPLG